MVIARIKKIFILLKNLFLMGIYTNICNLKENAPKKKLQLLNLVVFNYN